MKGWVNLHRPQCYHDEAGSHYTLVCSVGMCCLKRPEWQYGKLSAASGVVCEEGFTMREGEITLIRDESDMQIFTLSLCFKLGLEAHIQTQ